MLRLILTTVMSLSFLAVVLPLPANAQAEGQTILLRNVSLVGDEGSGDKIEINILLNGGVLDIITEDLVPLEDADATYDAAGGVVLGQLKLGEPANFIILDEDPRQNRAELYRMPQFRKPQIPR